MGKMGRPASGKTAVLRAHQALGLQHFAFLRACLQGIDLRAAWTRYLAFGEASDDLRHIQRRKAEILATVLSSGHLVNPTLPANAKVSDALAVLGQHSPSPSTDALPSLQDFATIQGIDADHFSQAELLAEYKAHYGLDQLVAGLPAPAHGLLRDTSHGTAHPLQRQLQALNHLELLLARMPQPADHIDLWFAPVTLRRLTAVGASTLSALCAHIGLHGHGWFRPVRGLGATRAAAVLAWLAPLAKGWGTPLPDAALQPPQRRGVLRQATLRGEAQTPRFALVPLEQLVVPPMLAGGTVAPGRFASRLPNDLAATNDLEAILAWLATHATTPATHRAYRKEVERFYLWCLLVQRRALSSIDADDCQGYRRFLADVPADWCQPLALPRQDPAWRPFRRPLQASSQRYALVVVQALFDGLRTAHWLVANPMAAVRKAAPLPVPPLDTSRSFNDTEWVFVLSRLTHLEAAALARPTRSELTAPRGAEQRRLRLVLELLCSTGLRLAELAAASTADLSAVAAHGLGKRQPRTQADTQNCVLAVVGQAGKQRLVPVDGMVLGLLRAHHADAAALGPLPSPAPLVCTLKRDVSRWVASDGEFSGPSTGTSAGVQLRAGCVSAHRALGASGVYKTLKRFFTHIAHDAHAVDGLSATHIQAASTHWLRHTFGRQAASAGVPLQVLQQAFGHASPNTTAAYLAGSATAQMANTGAGGVVDALREVQARRRDRGTGGD